MRACYSNTFGRVECPKFKETNITEIIRVKTKFYLFPVFSATKKKRKGKKNSKEKKINNLRRIGREHMRKAFIDLRLDPLQILQVGRRRECHRLRVINRDTNFRVLVLLSLNLRARVLRPHVFRHGLGTLISATPTLSRPLKSDEGSNSEKNSEIFGGGSWEGLRDLHGQNFLDRKCWNF